MATIRKRSWTTLKGERKAAWLVTYKDRRGARREKQFARKRDAEAWMTQAAWEVVQGVHTAESQSITVAQAADIWIARAEIEGRERSTVKQYRELARIHIVPYVGSERLSRLSMPAVEAFRDMLVTTRSRAMAGKAVRALSSILSEAQRRGLVAQNVAKGVRVVRVKRDRKKITIPPREHLRAMLDASEAFPSFRPILLTAIFTGLRSSELRALRRQDVDLKAGEITVEQRADQWGVIGSPKSEAGYRTVPIPPLLVSELRTWMLRAPVSSLGLVFPNSTGGVRLHSNMLSREYWPLQLKAGLTRFGSKPQYDFHCLRHSTASNWIKQGVDLKRLTTWLGHSGVQITLDTYGHLIKDGEADAAIAAAAQRDLLG